MEVKKVPQKIKIRKFQIPQQGNGKPPKEQTTHFWKYQQVQTRQYLNVISWNVNGVRTLIDKKHLNTLLQKYDPDIICVNETKIDEEAYSKSKIQIPNYEAYWNFCKISSGYSGVAVFSKYPAIRMIEDFPQKKQLSLQGRLITLEFKYFYLVCVYMPMVGVELQRLYFRVQKYNKQFYIHCNKLRQTGKPVIIAGDLNVVSNKELDMYRRVYEDGTIKEYNREPSATEVQRKSLKMFLETGWIDTFRKLNPDLKKWTWWFLRYKGKQRKIGKRLDYILLDKRSFDEKIVLQANVLDDIEGSDHCPVQGIFKFKAEFKNKILQRVKSISQGQNKDYKEQENQKFGQQDEKQFMCYFKKSQLFEPFEYDIEELQEMDFPGEIEQSGSNQQEKFQKENCQQTQSNNLPTQLNNDSQKLENQPQNPQKVQKIELSKQQIKAKNQKKKSLKETMLLLKTKSKG